MHRETFIVHTLSERFRQQQINLSLRVQSCVICTLRVDFWHPIFLNPLIGSYQDWESIILFSKSRTWQPKNICSITWTELFLPKEKIEIVSVTFSKTLNLKDNLWFYFFCRGQSWSFTWRQILKCFTTRKGIWRVSNPLQLQKDSYNQRY